MIALGILIALLIIFCIVLFKLEVLQENHRKIPMVIIVVLLVLYVVFSLIGGR